MGSTTKIPQLLLDHGAKINQQDNQGWTALHYAADRRTKTRPEVVAFYLSHGADPAIKDKQGLTALDIARHKENFQVAEILEQAATPEVQALIQSKERDKVMEILTQAWKAGEEKEKNFLLNLREENRRKQEAQKKDKTAA